MVFPRKSGAESHAYLLTMLVHPHPSPLAHFVSYFVPLSKQLFDLQQKASTEGRASEAKMWSVLTAQIWTGLSGYCWGTVDLQDVSEPKPIGFPFAYPDSFRLLLLTSLKSFLNSCTVNQNFAHQF
jgi:hypothetical protein